MLQAYATENGTGVSIFGDYGDLYALYNTVHHLSETLAEKNKQQNAQSELLMNFAYEIRHAYQGNRLTENIQFLDGKALPYCGFQLVWTDILIFISVLRNCAGYTQTDKMNQANLYMLEYVVEQAMLNYDPEGAKAIIDNVIHRIHTHNEYAFIIYQALHIKFVSEKPTKERFRKIPKLIYDHFTPTSLAYKDLISSFQKSAKEQQCDITELEFSEFPEIKW